MNFRQIIKTTQIQTLKQTLTPQLIQMLKTFHQPYKSLLNEVEQTAKENVFIEVKQFDQLSSYDYKARKTNIQNSEDKDISDYAESPKQKSLYNHLHEQIELLYLNPKDFKIAELIIEDINSRGYLENYSKTQEKIIKSLNIKERKVNDILKIIQTLDPEGVGARNLKECLLIQLKSHNFENKELEHLFKELIANHLEDIGNQNSNKLIKKFNLTEDGLNAATSFIKQNLNPNPGINFSKTQLNYHIIPSFKVDFSQKRPILTNLEKTKGIQINISPKYLELLENKSIDKETKEFLKERYQKAKTLVENIQKRQETLTKMISYIINKQTLFLEKGILYLEPLLQKELSEKLNISPSTVSRIVSSKYIETPHGMFSFKQLCPRNHFGKTAERLKLIIKNIVSNNIKISDEKITHLLNADNIPIARRTVTKYRLLTGLKSSFKR
ncbi:RNA polymerase sigma-54 factor [Candidatus Marinamargulisbacteria bacterium SCGC AG-410-N11]|nr:RNA polymerase sigma-54 factor [Candidatus Marinamargulisbacteria bacterium SCGC AG-410-N11]